MSGPSLDAAAAALTASFNELARLTEQVREVGACSLRGCTFDFDVFVPIMQRAVIRGFVPLASARFVAEGLRYGFMCGVNPSAMRGRRFFRNYPTAYDAVDKVSEAVRKRVASAKTLCLGSFDVSMKHLVPFSVCTCFPMGGVRKKMEDAVRPVDDHTRTGLNASVDMEPFRFKLRTHKEVAECFHKMFYMSVKDVSDAFPLIPLHPAVWPFMLFQWWSVLPLSGVDVWCLYVHLFAGFGLCSWPGVFKILFNDVMVGMARSEGHLTLPLPIFVDDTALIGSDRQKVDDEGASLAAFLLFLGVVMKELKTRYAALEQLYIGLWWNSVTRSLRLEDQKREQYLEEFDSVAGRHVMTLRDSQSLAGKLQRAALTFPPGSECIFSSIYAFMRGLSLPWQKRRISRGLQADVAWGAAMLRANLGRGYFSYDEFRWLPPAWTDASKSRGYVGAGYVSSSGSYCYWRYGSSAGRKPIDELEGDAVRVYVENEQCPEWRGCILPIYIDNKAFQASGAKGWSKADRLNDLLKDLFQHSVALGCIFMFYWISTHDNFLADALSRKDAPASFLDHPQLRDVLGDTVLLAAHATSGMVRHWGKGFSSSTDGDGPSHARGFPMALTVAYTRASIYQGVPSSALSTRVDQVMDNRLGASSHSSVRAALGHWDRVRARHGWSRIISTDDEARGGKLAVFVLYFVDETEVAYSTISNYVWALRTWMKFQRQIDPAFGLVEWSDFMGGVEVLTFVPAEPRKEVPGSWILGACQHADRSVFWEVQAVLLQLFLLYTFSRSEAPLCRSYSGEGGFDPLKHLQVQDVKVETVNGRLAVGVRLKAIKQDPRMQRPAARGEGDWVWIGAEDGPCNILEWLRCYFSFFTGGARDPTGPFFVRRDGADLSVPFLYSQGLSDVRALWARAPGVTPAMAASCGLHGLRVAGNNGCTKALGKELARVQGGWAPGEGSAQTRYDRHDLADVLRIPGAIVSSWAAREADFDFEAVTPVPRAVAASPPVERAVQVLHAAERNVRRAQPFPPRPRSAAAASSGGGRRTTSPPAPAARPLPSPAACVTQEPPRAAAAVPLPALPRHAQTQNRDHSSSCLALTRPVRSSRLAAVPRYAAGVSGTWTSADVPAMVHFPDELSVHVTYWDRAA